MNARRTALGAVALAGAYAVMHRVGSAWGATAAERRTDFPGDGLVPRPLVQSTHGLTVAASVSAV